MNESSDIDFVVTWVDGADPAWLESRRRFRPGGGGDGEKGAGGANCDVLPSYIDEDLYNRLVAMAPGSDAREAYRQDLLKRLPAAGVRFCVTSRAVFV